MKMGFAENLNLSSEESEKEVGIEKYKGLNTYKGRGHYG